MAVNVKRTRGRRTQKYYIMTTHVPVAVAAYKKAANDCDSAAFLACLASDALVNDVERNFLGIKAIKSWSDREVLVPKDKHRKNEGGRQLR
jgi:hypothetical protein